ncbi:MAG: hypothetical protein LBI13_11215 [Streptococcaceae bacterium]|nr:hypothetical protein [Streptococcaceae bacterium]
MATRLELAEQKLARLEKEFDTLAGLDTVPNREVGQPIHTYKASGRRDMAKLEKHHERVFAKMDEIKAQKERVEYLEFKEERAALGRSANGNIIYSVANISLIEQEIENREAEKAELKAQGKWGYSSQTALRNIKKRLAELKAMAQNEEEKQAKISKTAQNLIDLGLVKQWAKKPMFYFVAGMRKVALVIGDDGEFHFSKQYPVILMGDHAKLKGWGVLD